jgi:hypothetical protein
MYITYPIHQEIDNQKELIKHIQVIVILNNPK